MIDIKISANANIINNNFQEETRIYQHDFRTKILDPNQEDADWENEDFTKRTNKNINSHLSIFNQIIYFTPEQTFNNFKNNKQIYQDYNLKNKSNKAKLITSFNLVHTIASEEFDYWKEAKITEPLSDETMNLIVDYFTRYINFIKTQFINHQLLGAIIHFDETHPHLHLHISAYNDETHKFDRRTFMTKDFLKQLKSAENKWIDNWIENHQKKYEKVDSLYEDTTLQNSLKKLRQDKQQIKNDINAFKKITETSSNNFKEMQNNLKELKELNSELKILKEEQEKQEQKLLISEISTLTEINSVILNIIYLRKQVLQSLQEKENELNNIMNKLSLEQLNYLSTQNNNLYAKAYIKNFIKNKEENKDISNNLYFRK